MLYKMYIKPYLDHYNPFTFPVFGHPITCNPLNKSIFKLYEYNNWNTISPTFTYKEYTLFNKIYTSNLKNTHKIKKIRNTVYTKLA